MTLAKDNLPKPACLEPALMTVADPALPRHDWTLDEVKALF
jgi:hypothetical protein